METKNPLSTDFFFQLLKKILHAQEFVFQQSQRGHDLKTGGGCDETYRTFSMPISGVFSAKAKILQNLIVGKSSLKI